MTENDALMLEKESHLTARDLRRILYFDYETGLFYSHRSDLRKAVGSTTAEGYVVIRVKGRDYMAHRLAWLYDKGRWPVGKLDHADGGRSHNRIENLREATQSVNMQNQRRAHRGSRSGLLGAHWHSQKQEFYAEIVVNKRKIHLGYFGGDAEAAHNAYLDAKRKVHSGCTI